MRKALEKKIRKQYREEKEAFIVRCKAGWYKVDGYNKASDDAIFQSDLIDESLEALYNATLLSYESKEELKALNEELRMDYEDLIYDTLAA